MYTYIFWWPTNLIWNYHNEFELEFEIKIETEIEFEFEHESELEFETEFEIELCSDGRWIQLITALLINFLYH